MCDHCRDIRVTSRRELPAVAGVTIVAERAGERVVLGVVSALTLETIALIVDTPATNGLGEPLDPRQVVERFACGKV